MAKEFAAVGTFSDDGSGQSAPIPETLDEMYTTLDEILDRYNSGDLLSAEDQVIIKSYLPVLGVDDASLTTSNALVGEGSFEFNRSALDCDIHAKGYMGCKDVGEARIEYTGEMSVNKTGGSTNVIGFKFTFRAASFGMGPTGAMKLIYKREFDRAFDSAESAATSFHDRYTFTQWGFYYTAACEVITEKGSFIVR